MHLFKKTKKMGKFYKLIWKDLQDIVGFFDCFVLLDLTLTLDLYTVCQLCGI